MPFFKDTYNACLSVTNRYFSSGVDLCRYLYGTLVTNRPSKKEMLETAKHSFDVIRTARSNYKRHKVEKRHLKQLDEKLKKDHGKSVRDASWIGRILGVSDVTMPMVMSAIPHLPVLLAGGLIYGMQLVTGFYRNIAFKQRQDIKNTVDFEVKSNLTKAYIQSQSVDANKVKEQSPKVSAAISTSVDKDVDMKRAKTSLLVNAAFLTALNPISGLLVGGISLYNWASNLYNLRRRKKPQAASIAAHNQYGMTADRMVDAAPVLRETHNTSYADKKIAESQEKALEKAKEFSQNNLKLSMKNVPFNALVSATIWSASLIAGASAGSGFAAAAVFAAAMMASERVLYSAISLLQYQAQKIDLYRTYKENMKGLEYEKQNIRTGDKTLDTSNGYLQVLDMDYHHASGKGVEEISLNFEKGDIHVIAGESGSGKSTIMDLLQHKMDPQSGEILIDGVPLTQLTEETVLKQISVIPQEPVFLRESIREELKLFNKDATDEKMQSVLEKVGLGDLSLDRDVFEEGSRTLSGGQLQRLAIARALLRESPILLMDEPTSSLDASSKQAVWDTIESLKDEKTIIIVSHDAFEIANADDLTILEDGRITGKGSPLALMEASHPFIEQVQERIQNSVLKEDETYHYTVTSGQTVPTNTNNDTNYFSANTSTKALLMSFSALDSVYNGHVEEKEKKDKLTKAMQEKNHHMMQRKTDNQHVG